MTNILKSNGVMYCLVAMLTLATSCTQRTLFSGDGGDEDGPLVVVKITWPTLPEGARVIFYPTSGGTPVVYNIPAGGKQVYVPEGTYNVVIFNNDTEYTKLYNDDKVSTLEARTTTIVKSGLVKSFPSQDVVNMPDEFYSCKVNDFKVTAGVVPDTLKVATQERVQTFNVRVYVDGTGGVSHISSATGYISGLYGSFFPGTDTYPVVSSAVPFNFSERGSNYIEGTVRTFGVNRSGSDNIQMFKIVLTLGDGSTAAYEGEITNQLNVDLTKIGVLIIIPSTINVSAGSSSSSSNFNVTVDDWGNPTEVNI